MRKFSIPALLFLTLGILCCMGLFGTATSLSDKSRQQRQAIPGFAERNLEKKIQNKRASRIWSRPSMEMDDWEDDYDIEYPLESDEASFRAVRPKQSRRRQSRVKVCCTPPHIRPRYCYNCGSDGTDPPWPG